MPPIKSKGGPGPEALAVCGTPLGTGGTAQVVLAGTEPFALAILLIAGSDSQFFSPAFGLSTIVPIVYLIQFANAAGVKQFPVTGGSGENGVIEAYIQYLVTNGTSGTPQGWSASNVSCARFCGPALTSFWLAPRCRPVSSSTSTSMWRTLSSAAASPVSSTASSIASRAT